MSPSSTLINLAACSRLIKVLQDPENRDKLEHEIEYAGTLTEDQWGTPSDIRWTMPMFPFVTTCLISGATIYDTPLSARQVRPEPWNMPINGGDNNTGITILDITEPEVRYCFTLLPAVAYDETADDEMAADDDSENADNKGCVMVPLSGNDYMGEFSQPEDWGWIAKKGVNSLKNRPLIDAGSLNEAWPDGPTWSVREEANWFKSSQSRVRRGSGRKGKKMSWLAKKGQQRRLGTSPSRPLP